jgi:hypothetical protein
MTVTDEQVAALRAFLASAVIGLVAIVRAQLLDDGIHIDPRTSESLMRRALGDAVAADPEEPATARARVLLLGELIVDEGLDDAGLDEFLAQARTLADRLMPDVTRRR